MSKEENDTNRLTFEKSEEEYGPDYQSHLMELYKFYAATADAVSTRRQSANVFFLTLNTALIALIGYSFRSNTAEKIFLWLLILVVIVGLILCCQWYRTIKSHQQLNDGKFKVITLIEEKLPFAPYVAEWKALGKGKDPKKYKKVTDIEMKVPWLFFSLHTVLLCLLIWRQCN